MAVSRTSNIVKQNQFSVRGDIFGYMFEFGDITKYRELMPNQPIVAGYHGEYIFVPSQSFTGLVEIWGAGGGAGHNTNGSNGHTAGGGGYARGNILFQKDIPYCLVVGQGGDMNPRSSNRGNLGYRQVYRVGGGGQGHDWGGSGGGMSGIFFNSLGGINSANTSANVTVNNDVGNSAGFVFNASTRAFAVSQANALLISGGGGGAGHTDGGSHHAGAGGGGGTNGNGAHNISGGTQNAGGNHWTNSAQSGYAMHGGHASNSTAGGGGGGWYGGGGGAHAGSQSHHNGGSGGSGHAVNQSNAGHPNHGFSSMVFNSVLETAPASHQGGSPQPAQFSNPGNGAPNTESAAGYAGGQNGKMTGNDGRIVITIA